ncbi:hypothetical protein A1O3_07675 [Capronia epimyces CBS 606.96]|uniref:aldehyde dehydrogenase (NAD(+)) n=1 Tax=Capronia epimyces CBS 606.96 TaxID=1182542 RepID=W9YGI9_9EURO|nr:uncharacterized protein A1O3_07675 [Capronia epimyces CBS 606.96]EXJ81384.1 hypothetical protein A1O3_07675 [Capronia epimyces CBS 606.96]
MPLKYELPLKPFIHGKFVDSKGSDRLTLRSAVDDSVLTEELQSATPDDVDVAVASAEEGFKAWLAIPPEGRRAILWKFADLIEENAERLAYLEAILVGKPLGVGIEYDARGCAESFRFFAGFIDKFEGDFQSIHDGFIRAVHLEPLGVCAAICPFNSPLITFGMKAAPALAVGNSLVTKASEFNPFSTLALAELAIAAGIPPGTLNVVVGEAAAGAALSSHMKVRKISFTGSAAVGRKVQIAAAQSNLKRVTLELGGKSPVLVFDDADLATAVTNSMSFVMYNGQGCILGTRIYVQEGIAEQFVQVFKQSVEGFASTLGADPLELTTMSAPIFHRRQQETVLGFLEKGKQEAEVLTGGNAHPGKGLFIQPTIFTRPKADADIVKKEIFGPVVVIDTFKTEEEVLQKANDTEYGLGAYVYTSNIDRAFRAAHALEAGAVAVNTARGVHNTIPFGGWKASGIGSENGKYVLREYSHPKSITIK